MQGQKIVYTTAAMTKEQFFYAYKELAHKHDRHILLESGRGGALCMAGIDPLVTLRTLMAINYNLFGVMVRKK